MYEAQEKLRKVIRDIEVQVYDFAHELIVWLCNFELPDFFETIKHYFSVYDEKTHAFFNVEFDNNQVSEPFFTLLTNEKGAKTLQWFDWAESGLERESFQASSWYEFFNLAMSFRPENLLYNELSLSYRVHRGKFAEDHLIRLSKELSRSLNAEDGAASASGEVLILDENNTLLAKQLHSFKMLQDMTRNLSEFICSAKQIKTVKFEVKPKGGIKDKSECLGKFHAAKLNFMRSYDDMFKILMDYYKEVQNYYAALKSPVSHARARFAWEGEARSKLAEQDADLSDCLRGKIKVTEEHARRIEELNQNWDFFESEKERLSIEAGQVQERAGVLETVNKNMEALSKCNHTVIKYEDYYNDNIYQPNQEILGPQSASAEFVSHASVGVSSVTPWSPPRARRFVPRSSFLASPGLGHGHIRSKSVEIPSPSGARDGEGLSLSFSSDN